MREAGENEPYAAKLANTSMPGAWGFDALGIGDVETRNQPHSHVPAQIFYEAFATGVESQAVRSRYVSGSLLSKGLQSASHLSLAGAKFELCGSFPGVLPTFAVFLVGLHGLPTFANYLGIFKLSLSFLLVILIFTCKTRLQRFHHVDVNPRHGFAKGGPISPQCWGTASIPLLHVPIHAAVTFSQSVSSSLLLASSSSLPSLSLLTSLPSYSLSVFSACFVILILNQRYPRLLALMRRDFPNVSPGDLVCSFFLLVYLAFARLKCRPRSESISN